MKKYYIIIGMLLVSICCTIIYGIKTPRTPIEFTFDDHIEDVELTESDIETYVMLVDEDIKANW